MPRALRVCKRRHGVVPMAKIWVQDAPPGRVPALHLIDPKFRRSRDTKAWEPPVLLPIVYNDSPTVHGAAPPFWQARSARALAPPHAVARRLRPARGMQRARVHGGWRMYHPPGRAGRNATPTTLWKYWKEVDFSQIRIEGQKKRPHRSRV
jgi:hypothetical protein